MFSVCLYDILKSYGTKEIVIVPNTSLIVHYKNGNDHQAEAHVTWCLYLLHDCRYYANKIGLLLCHSHVELRLKLRLIWVWGWSKAELRLRLRLIWGQFEILLELTWFGVELIWGWVELGLSWDGVELSWSWVELGLSLVWVLLSWGFVELRLNYSRNLAFIWLGLLFKNIF